MLLSIHVRQTSFKSHSFSFELRISVDPGGSKSRRLISQLSGNSSSSKASLRTVVSFFYIVYQIVFVILS